MLKEMKGPYYIVCGYTDLRREIDGLAGIIQQNYKLDACSGGLFLFCGKRCDGIKALLWEGDGFLLLYKRLNNGRFVTEKQNGGGANNSRTIHMADAGACDRTAQGNKTSFETGGYHLICIPKPNRKNIEKLHKHWTFRHIYGIKSVSEICFGGSARMKILENVSPEIAAYIKALQD